jgi:hypothetical protein
MNENWQLAVDEAFAQALAALADARAAEALPWLELRAGWQLGDVREVLGQLPRILAALLFSRLWVPLGNSGRARVSAFKPMPLSEELRRLLDQATP